MAFNSGIDPLQRLDAPPTVGGRIRAGDRTGANGTIYGNWGNAGQYAQSWSPFQQGQSFQPFQSYQQMYRPPGAPQQAQALASPAPTRVGYRGGR